MSLNKICIPFKTNFKKKKKKKKKKNTCEMEMTEQPSYYPN